MLVRQSYSFIYYLLSKFKKNFTDWHKKDEY